MASGWELDYLHQVPGLAKIVKKEQSEIIEIKRSRAKTRGCGGRRRVVAGIDAGG